MKKYMIVGLLLLQGALLKASEVEFYKAIAPSLQNAKSVLQNPMISAELDPVLNGLLGAVQNGTISKQAALNIINDIKNAVEAYKSKQYSNSWLSWFVSTPKIVKDTVQPALDKVNNAIAALNGNEWTPLAIAGVTVGAVAGAVAAVGGGYAGYKWNENRKKRLEEAAAYKKDVPHPGAAIFELPDIGPSDDVPQGSDVSASPAFPVSPSRRAVEQSSSTPPPPPTPPLASALSGANIISGPALEEALFNRHNLLDGIQFDATRFDKALDELYAGFLGKSRAPAFDVRLVWPYLSVFESLKRYLETLPGEKQTPENLVGFIFDCTEFQTLLARKDVVYKIFPQYVANGSLEAGIRSRIEQGAIVIDAYSVSSSARATDRHSAAASAGGNLVYLV